MSVRPHLARRLVRLVPAALAVYECRSLLGSFAGAGAALRWLAALHPGSPALWLLLALALAAGALLRESARGLFAALALGALIAGASGGHAHPLAGDIGPFGWAAAVPAALLAGLPLTGVRGVAAWLLRALARLRPRPPHPRRLALPVRRPAVAWRPHAAPNHSGWSGRGPPPAALAAACL